jgi:hypothetical protein
MRLTKMNRNKGQVSLEYILIVGAVISLLLIIVTTSSILYKKNISAIDDRELLVVGDKLQEILDTLELMPAGIEKIIITPENTWILEYKDYSKKTIILGNGNKEKSISSISDIYLENNSISAKSEIIINKMDNKIYIDIKMVD